MHKLSFETALSTMKVIADYTAADFDALGITQQDFEMASGPTPFRRDNLNRVMRTLNALLFGTLEVLAMPKIVVPAEYVASVITAFVHPANRMIACVWLAQERQTGVGALELAARGGSSQQMGPASADQLFALVLELSNSSESTQARATFRQRLGLAAEKAAQESFIQ